MIKSILPIPLKDVILHDAIQRDVTTARRVALPEILWNEHYLTRVRLEDRTMAALPEHPPSQRDFDYSIDEHHGSH